MLLCSNLPLLVVFPKGKKNHVFDINAKWVAEDKPEILQNVKFIINLMPIGQEVMRNNLNV